MSILDRLGVLTDEVSPNLDEALAWIEEQGLKHVEIRMVDGKNVMNLSAEELQAVADKVKAHGLFVSGIASPVFKCALDPNREVMSGDTFGQEEESVEAHHAKLDQAIQIAKKLGTKNIRIFSFWREIEPTKYTGDIVAELKKAAAVAEKEDIVLLLENEPSCNGGFASEIAMLSREVNSPALKALWDPGNEAYGDKEAYPAGYNSLKDVVGHVHLKDAFVNEKGEGNCVPIGQGTVDFVGQFKALEADGYEGLFTIETHYIPSGGTPKDGTQMTLDALRELLKSL